MVQTQTTCKPSDKCSYCRGGGRRYIESHWDGQQGRRVHTFFHHLHEPENKLVDCEDQTYANG